MKCPNCAAEAAAGAKECPSCGVIFAKLIKKLETLEPAPSPEFNPWIGRGIAAALLVAWFIVFGFYYRRRVAAMKVLNPSGPARTR